MKIVKKALTIGMVFTLSLSLSACGPIDKVKNKLLDSLEADSSDSKDSILKPVNIDSKPNENNEINHVDDKDDSTSKNQLDSTKDQLDSTNENDNLGDSLSDQDSEKRDDSNNENMDQNEESSTAIVKSDDLSANHIEEASKYAYDTNQVKEWSKDSDYKGPKLAFLTFDDGISQITPKILDTLKEKDARATFFMIGKSLGDSTKPVLERMYNEGNALALHSMWHDYDVLYPDRYPDTDAIYSEVSKQNQVIKDLLGSHVDTKVFRYPGGHMSWNKEGLKKSDKALEDNGYKWVDWNSMNGDAQSKRITKQSEIPRPKSVEQALLNVDTSKLYAANSDVLILLMHDAGDKELTAKSLGALIDHLREQGYEFGILS